MAEKIQVLHVIDSMNLGGAQRVLLNLFSAFQHPRYELAVAALHGPGIATKHFVATGAYPMHLSTSKYDPRLLYTLRRHIRDGGFSIVHAHLVPSGFLCETFRGLLGIRRLVSHVHNLYLFHETNHYQNLLERRMYRRADCVVACSRNVLESIPRPIPGKVIYNGLDEATLNHLAALPDRVEARRLIGIAEDAFVVGTTGRISQAKNHVLLCRAAAALRNDLPNLVVLIVGTGPEENAVRHLAAELGIANRVIVTGYQADVAPYLAAMDVFAMTSHGEGLPMALIEAMAAGKACVVPDTAWAREVTTADKTALHFQPNSADDLADRIRTLAPKPILRAALGETAQHEAHVLFNATEMAQQTAAVYDELMAKHE